MIYDEDFTVLGNGAERAAGRGGERIEAFSRTGKLEAARFPLPPQGFHYLMESLTIQSNQHF
jgi:hypothetical protein